MYGRVISCVLDSSEYEPTSQLLKFRDPSPPRVPTHDEQADALRKGLGRTMEWVTAGLLDEELLSHALLHDLRYDSQVDSQRAPWLWGLLVAANATERLREPLLIALRTLSDPENAYQLCGLGYFYAERGDPEFLQALYDIVEKRPVPEWGDLALKDLLKIDEERALLFVAEIRGNELKSREWNQEDHYLRTFATEQLGDTRSLTLLSESDDSDIRRFHDRWLVRQKLDAERPPSQDQRERDKKQRSAEEIVASAESGRSRRYIHSRWGKYQSEEVLSVVAEAFWSTEDPPALVNYLSLFSERPMPTFDPRLFDLCSHEDENVSFYAYKALAMMSRPEIRAFALEKIRQGQLDGSVFSLFARNYVAGDEEMLLERLDLPEDDHLHWLLGEVIKVLQENEEADPLELGLIVYHHTPCEYCRLKAVKILHARNRMPDWMRNECRHDSSEECRSFIQEINNHTTSETL